MAYCCSLTVCKVGLQQKRQFVEEFPPLVLQCQFKGGRKTLPYNMLCCTYWVKSSDFGVELFICFEKYIQYRYTQGRPSYGCSGCNCTHSFPALPRIFTQKCTSFSAPPRSFIYMCTHTIQSTWAPVGIPNTTVLMSDY